MDDLGEFYSRLKEKNVAIDRVSDHGLSLGIYLHDPDGNGIEVYYEIPRSEWPTEEKRFSERTIQGQFPGPWEKDLTPDAIARK